jgi:hypothetical protein
MEKDMFGDKPDTWEFVSWTANLDIAIKWRNRTHRDERFDFEQIPKQGSHGT